MLATLAYAAPAMPAAEQTPVGPVPGPRQALAPKGKPDTSDPPTLAEGRRLFIQFNCYGCHGGRAGGGMGPSLRDADWIYGSSPANIYSSISQGRAKGMPAWSTRVPERQIWQLVAYIRSLGTDDEPARPRE
jgi:cytochrome c oxidase cbb3-type subunit 3